MGQPHPLISREPCRRTKFISYQANSHDGREGICKISKLKFVLARSAQGGLRITTTRFKLR
jgi:hypothetical protein